MELSMWMIYDAISDFVCEHNLGQEEVERKIIGAMPFLPDEPFSQSHIYVIQSSAVTKSRLREKCFLVICGTKNPVGEQQECRYIRMNPEISPGAAFKLVLGVFEKYNNWYDRLRQELIGTPDLTRICEIGNEMLDNYIALFDPEHILIAHAALPPHMFGPVLEKKRGPYYALTDDAYKALINDPNHWDDTRAEHAAFFVDPTLNINVMYANIGPGTFECRLCIGENIRKFRRSDTQLCEILAQILLSAFQGYYLSSTDTKTYFRDLLRSLLKGQPIEDLVLDRNLSVWQWNRNDRFICLNIEKLNPEGRFLSSDRYICSRAEELLVDACSFMMDGKIVCVARLLDESPAAVSSRLVGFVRESILVVGVSCEFADIMDAASYYKEAAIAVQMGRDGHNDERIHIFSDYALPHFFRYGVSVLPAIHYCDAGVRKLAQMDDTKVDYCQTLRVYLENDRNLLHAAKALHIHRTTLFYRLNRIRELIDADLDDNAARLRMLFSLKLMEFEKNPGKSILS